MLDPYRDTVALGVSDGGQPWWQRAVLYQVYVRSFADSNGDGIGDRGGSSSGWTICGGWESMPSGSAPSLVSPDRDRGSDVADYTDAQPAFGSPLCLPSARVAPGVLDHGALADDNLDGAAENPLEVGGIRVGRVRDRDLDSARIEEPDGDREHASSDLDGQ